MTLRIFSSEPDLAASKPSRRLLVAIATPCTDLVHAGYALDLVKLTGYMARERPDVEIAVVQNRGTIIPQQRATLVMLAQEIGASHVLFIDSDMRFPKDALERLLGHETPIVAANYSRRRDPVLPTAEHKQHGYLFTPDDAFGLAEVTHCGMGLMLVEMSVFEKLSQPWFHIGFQPKTNDYIGEDFFFCSKAREAGYTIAIDQGLSVQVKHIGAKEFTNADSNVALAREAAASGA